MAKPPPEKGPLAAGEGRRKKAAEKEKWVFHPLFSIYIAGFASAEAVVPALSLLGLGPPTSILIWASSRFPSLPFASWKVRWNGKTFGWEVSASS